jgi:hypothetical protein
MGIFLPSILIIATRYDSVSRRMYRWARNLETTLTGHTVSTLYGPAVSPASLSSMKRADFVIFFGHGEPDRLIGQKGHFSLGSGPTLVDTTTLTLFGGSRVYAVCCQAGIHLAPAYSQVYPSASFIAYQAPFGFSYPNAADFESIVNQSAVQLFSGTPSSAVHGNLQKEWRGLADAFLNGSKRNRRDAFLAGYAASTNSLFVSISP